MALLPIAEDQVAPLWLVLEPFGLVQCTIAQCLFTVLCTGACRAPYLPLPTSCDKQIPCQC